MESENKNPYNLKVTQKYLVKHKSNLSPWIEVYIPHLDGNGVPMGRNVEQCFYESLTDEYEVINPSLSAEEEAEKAWIERASRDKQQYASEEQAFAYYWNMTH
jgi:hypothetical protein